MNEENKNLSDAQGEEEEKKKRSGAVILFTIVGIVLVIYGGLRLGNYLYGLYQAQSEIKEEVTVATTEPATAEQLQDNPIDFDALFAENDEQYAWIKVPGTKVDYPICQSKTDDAFYLKHKASDKSYSNPGAIFTEAHNTKTFNDRVTLIYGHNGYSDTMFASLHNFDKADFFDEHEYFYIYTPHSIKTYEIISVFKYDNRHIMNSFDFQNDTVFLDFMNMIRNPESTLKHTRDSFTRELTLDDKIVILSTCVWKQDSNRFLVCGVLISDEKTN